jgi:hypothetical protein
MSIYVLIGSRSCQAFYVLSKHRDLKTGWVKLGKVRLGWVRLGWTRLSQVRLGKKSQLSCHGVDLGGPRSGET